jgi:magnesium transporter
VKNVELNHTELIQFLMVADKEQMELFLEEVHPADILDAVHEYEGDPLELLRHLPEQFIASIIDEAEDEEKYELLTLFSKKKQMDIVDEMSSDELVDLLGAINETEQDSIIVNMDAEDAAEVRELLAYEPETAGGIMATEFLALKDQMSVGDTLDYLQKEAPDAETFYYIYVLDDDGVLKGVVSLRDMVKSSFDTKLGDIMKESVISVSVDMDQEAIGRMFEKYGYLIIPVVSLENKMLGIITVDDIMEILIDEDTEDLYRLAGLQESEKVAGGVRESVKSRLPWLIVNLFTAILAAATVSLFEETIAKVVALATFMPIVAGMGGNAGTQTLTLIVRGIALGEVTLENAKKILKKEVGVGVLNGIVLGLAVAILGLIWEGSAVFGLVIGVAMLLNLIMATLAGYFVPLTLKKLNIDPALASAVFVTTVTDVLGFFFFLGLATVFISALI